MSAGRQHGLESASLARYAREAPDTPVEQVLSRAAMRAIAILVFEQQLLPPSERQPEPPADIRAWVVLLARTAGFRPSKRQPLPGAKVLGRACEQVRFCVHWDQLTRAVGANSPHKAASKLERELRPFFKFFRTESSDETEGA